MATSLSLKGRSPRLLAHLGVAAHARRARRTSPNIQRRHLHVPNRAFPSSVLRTSRRARRVSEPLHSKFTFLFSSTIASVFWMEFKWLELIIGVVVHRNGR
jgi:hypothetical protein